MGRGLAWSEAPETGIRSKKADFIPQEGVWMPRGSEISQEAPELS